MNLITTLRDSYRRRQIRKATKRAKRHRPSVHELCGAPATRMGKELHPIVYLFGGMSLMCSLIFIYLILAALIMGN